MLLRFRDNLWVYVALFAALSLPYWWSGEVVAPYRMAEEIGSPPARGDTHTENRLFSDYANSFLPQIEGLHHGKRSGWLALWSSRNELGYPLYQVSGFSPAYLPSWVIAQLTDSTPRFITVLSLMNCFLAGLFVMLLCRELGLTPLAGLMAGASLAASPLFMFWLTFPLFPAIWTWSAGALYSLARLAHKADFAGWAMMTFCTYSLLMTAYPQPVVFHAYIFLGYGLVLAYRVCRYSGFRALRSYLIIVVSAGIIGAAMALPVYLDLAHVASQSARSAPEPTFFTEILQRFDSRKMLAQFAMLSTFPEVFGNPVKADYPLSYYGKSLTPLVIFFGALCLMLRLRQTWGWWLAVVVLCAFEFIEPLYVFAVKYLFFNLSRSSPLGCVMLPLAILLAYGVDALVRRTRDFQYAGAVVAAGAGILAMLAVILALGFKLTLEVEWRAVLMTLIVVALLWAQAIRTSAVLLVLSLLLVGAYLSFPLMLRQDPAHIATSSPLVETMRTHLPNDSRYAVAAPGLAILPPNLNASLELSSLHTYNSLSSQRYHALIESLGGEVRTYGRLNAFINPDYGGTPFWMSNIALMLSSVKLVHDNLEYLGEVNGVQLHRVVSRMGCCLQIEAHEDGSRPETVHISRPQGATTTFPVKTLDQGDMFTMDVKHGPASLLVLSQKFHRDWRAEVRTAAGWHKARTVTVNDVFQGVWLPAEVDRVRMMFEPFVRFAWIAHAFWLLLLATLAYRAWVARLRPTVFGPGVSIR